MGLFGAVGLIFACLAATPAQAQAPAADPYGVAVLNALDKITARVSVIDVRLNEPVDFGTLRITVRACYQTPPEETPESTAYIDVVDDRPGAEAEVVFSGWMFASSPAVSAMEHPVYDVSVISCKERLPDTEDGSAP